jgi:catechol-2,3-dioxygenase
MTDGNVGEWKAPKGTRIGHTHLTVSDLDRSLGFYRDLLGFQVMQRFGDSAAFISDGEYHHHIGLNTWAGQGATPAPKGHTGLYRGEDVTANVEATATEEFVVKNEGNGKTFKKFTVSKITFKANDGKKIFARGKVSSDTVSETGTCYSWSNAAVDLVGPKSEKGSEDKSNEGGN